VIDARHKRRTMRSVLLPLTLLLAAAPARAQEAPPTLSLDEALELALRYSPAYRSQANNVHAAEWDLREAYGALLPSASATAGFQYQAEGDIRFGSLTGSDLGVGTTPASYGSDYYFGFGYRLDGQSVARVGLQRALRTSASADTRAAAVDLATQITSQYVTALREQDGIELSEREVALAEENLRLATARAAVGAGTSLQVKQAEVELGRARVGLLTATNQALIERLTLLRLIGVDVDTDVQLTTEFEVFEPTWSADDLLEIAAANHPSLRALRARRDAGRAGVRAATLTYLPSLQLSAGWSGYAREVADEDAILDDLDSQVAGQAQQCATLNLILTRLNPPLPAEDCSQFVVTPELQQQALSRNDVFPFDYSDQPFTASAQITLPIFQGFARQAQIEEAKVAADDARYALRANELLIRSNVIGALSSLETAYTAVQLEARNAELAAEQLELSQERYRLGAISFIELAEATTLKARADRAYLSAVYSFHHSLATLEAAVGQNLRDPEPDQD